MKKFIETYRGAHIFELHLEKKVESMEVDCLLVAQATLPEAKNLKADFKEHAPSLEQGLIHIKKDIDRFLKERGISRFARSEYEEVS